MEEQALTATVATRRFTDALGAARTAAAGRLADRTALDAAAIGLAAAEQVQAIGGLLVEARVSLAEATRAAQDLRDAYLDLREARISGMAAELATGLAVGCSCPVCGSSDHPSPAMASRTVSSADEDAARGRHETADFERQAVQESVTSLETRIAGARQRAHDLSVAHWRAVHAEATAAYQASTAAEARVAELLSSGTALADEEKRTSHELTRLKVAREERIRAHGEASARRDLLAEELRALIAGHDGATTVTGLVAALSGEVNVLERAHRALTERHDAAEAHSAAVDRSLAAALAAGFEHPDLAAAAVLEADDVTARSAELDLRRAAHTSAREVLAERCVADALGEDPVDLEALADSVLEAQNTRDRRHAGHEAALRRRARLTDLGAELAEELRAWEPVRREHALTAGLAALVEGKSSDNRHRMRLSAYVLSERLRQVVAGANERLGTMTDQRYALEQVEEKGAGEQRGGLSLRVRDEWSGKERDPATLSGGETFLVSLALALGLADTVSHEAGGTQLDTLFIDEGFGSLDATTLDGVMDTLDALRDGGRVVGLVSHVPELRNRVTAQLEVRKDPRGSTLTPRLNAG